VFIPESAAAVGSIRTAVVDRSQTSESPAGVGELASFDQQDHACLIYEGTGDQLPVAVPFIKQGLDRGECCVYVVDDVAPAQLIAALEAAGVDVAAEQARGAFVQLVGAEFGPGQQRVDAWLNTLGETVTHAQAAGFSGLRIAVDMTWALTTGIDLSLVKQLESMANDLFYRDRPVLGLCQYNRDRFSTDVLAGALTTHPIAVVEGVVYRNLHYQPPEVLFGEFSQRERVQWMLDELKRQRHEQDQRDELIRAEATAQARAEFLATASHELRTPVTSIRGFVQLALRRLSAESSPELQEVRDMMTVVNAQVDRLARLVSQLFDVSRTQTGKLSLDQRPYDLGELVRQSVRAAELITDKHHFTVDAPAQLVLPLDDLRFSRVLTNLLDNAVKYSPDGGAIDLEVHSTDDGGALLSVRDHGIGVPADRRGSLFEPFYQVHPQNGSGMGLGLYLSHQIVEQHGGQLTAEFPDDGGSRFVVSLPGPGNRHGSENVPIRQ
jgi:signal transduction histidine kinase